jgi:hypothetical protein
VQFCGQTADPARALSSADIFFYPLQADHYGTSENALIEPMSLGLAPVVLDNPVEKAIVRDGVTGRVVRSADECADALQMLMAAPDAVDRMGQTAARDVADTRSPAASAQQFMDVWRRLSDDPVRNCDFRSAIGATPADWFLATQRLPGASWDASAYKARSGASKGTLEHFESVFGGDKSLAMLRQDMARRNTAAPGADYFGALPSGVSESGGLARHGSSRM